LKISLIKIGKNLIPSNVLNHVIVTGVKRLALIGIASVILSVVTAMPSYEQICYGCDDSSRSKNNAQQNQVELTDKGSIKVGFYTDPAKPNTSNQTKFSISFLNKDSGLIQQHIDYKVFIKKGTDQIFGIPVTHTGQGSVTVPFQFTDARTYQIVVEVDGILFQPITPETATFTVGVESASAPEFPFAILVLLVSVASVIAFNKIRK